MVAWLLEKGANVHSKNVSRGGQQPIHLSAMMGNEAIFHILHRAGADLHSRTSSCGATAVQELAAR